MSLTLCLLQSACASSSTDRTICEPGPLYISLPDTFIEDKLVLAACQAWRPHMATHGNAPHLPLTHWVIFGSPCSMIPTFPVFLRWPLCAETSVPMLSSPRSELCSSYFFIFGGGGCKEKGWAVPRWWFYILWDEQCPKGSVLPQAWCCGQTVQCAMMWVHMTLSFFWRYFYPIPILLNNTAMISQFFVFISMY